MWTSAIDKIPVRWESGPAASQGRQAQVSRDSQRFSGLRSAWKVRYGWYKSKLPRDALEWDTYMKEPTCHGVALMVSCMTHNYARNKCTLNSPTLTKAS